MKRTNTQSISEIIDNFFQDNPLIANKIAERRLINSWETTLGKASKSYTENLYIRNKILYVKLTSSVLRNELSMCRQDLISRLNQNAGMDVIEDIIFS